MRYVVAMLSAGVCAFIAAAFLSSKVASWVVNGFTFESPDQVATMHGAVFMGVNVLALLVGWGIGWGLVGAPEPDDD